MKRRLFSGMSFLAIVLFLAGGLAWTAPRQPQASPAGDTAKEIILIAPVGAHASIDQLAPAFEAKTGYKIKATYAASGAIKKKVIDGEQFDLSILLMPIADALATGNLAEGTLKTLGSVPIAIAVKKGSPKPDISTPESLKQALLAAKAVSYPHGAPGALSAVLIDDMISKLGITDQILPKIKPGGTGAVVKGDVDIALAFQPEINDPGVDIVGPMPSAVSTPAPMVGVVSAHAKNAAVAQQLLDYLATPAAKAVYKSVGIIPAS